MDVLRTFVPDIQDIRTSTTSLRRLKDINSDVMKISHCGRLEGVHITS